MADNMFRLAELMASRLCHDLVGPIGAVRNGLELAAEDPEMAKDAMELTQDSVEKLAATTQLFRMAYGAAGDSLDPQEAERLLRAFLAKYRTELSWRVAPMGLDATLPKLLINAALICLEALPRGGEIEVAAEGGELAGRVSARGQDVRPPAPTLAVLDAKEEPTAQTLQGAVLRVLAERSGLAVSCAASEGRLSISLTQA